ncbi:aldehyde-activating protein [Mesorhizobium sp. Root157]|uniref:GFA family protein n=1 Tax=Mesorhizobium sp. Root157 TaxID=1736477 RepID=UPI000700A814|nr:GFA family protein [Mesorhizobium sp. Root157]KQZ96038.1 aldehyde-activating protein [Mesorhizobium sp. Root157]
MTHQGGCHCGKVRFQVDVDLSSPITCNCSYCSKRGSMLAFTPAESFSLEKGDGDLTEYRFNTKTIAHLFCASCGMESFARATMPDGIRMVAVNVRCLDGVDADALTSQRFDGRSR